MSLFQTLSGVFQPGQKPKPSIFHPVPKRPKFQKPQKPVSISVEEKKRLQEDIIRDAQTKAREIILESRDEALKIRSQAEQEARRLQNELGDKQRQIAEAENQLVKNQASVEAQEKYLKQQQQQTDEQLQKIDEVKKKYAKLIQQTASMSKDEAQQIIFKNLEKRLSVDIVKTIKAAEEKAREEADAKAQEILVDAMKHGATDYVSEYTVSTVKLPSEDSKGRIIGKEGRNIRAFENATGVDLDLDETPGEVRLSSFDSIRREIARVSLSRLVSDGRIQPTRIEEYVAKAKTDIEKIMFEEGKKLCHAVGVYNLPPELIAMLGRFKYRFSYGQNMIAHTLEETKIGIALAQNIGADVDTVRLGCLLHDIGKIVEDEEGSHVELGVNLLKKYNIPQPVIDTVAQHHEDTPFTSAESVLVYVADAISGSRPGARYENYEEYVKRLGKLEEIATSYEGVGEAYAIQAGREIRVILRPDKLGDEAVPKLAFDIKERIRNEMTYPGTVTVTVMREVRATEIAK